MRGVRLALAGGNVRWAERTDGLLDFHSELMLRMASAFPSQRWRVKALQGLFKGSPLVYGNRIKIILREGFLSRRAMRAAEAPELDAESEPTLMGRVDARTAGG
jgi:hypothetical protein